MKKNWVNFINPPLVYHKKNQKEREECRWEPPSYGLMKLNFDGASRGNLGMIGIRYIIHSNSGNWIIKRAKPLEIATNNMAELEALQEGLKLSLQLGIRRLIIEGDL